MNQPAQSELLRRLKRVAITTVGAMLILAGLLMIPLPLPGAPLTLLGLGLLATQFGWASRCLRATRRACRQARSQPGLTHRKRFQRTRKSIAVAIRAVTTAISPRRLPLPPTASATDTTANIGT